MSDLHFKTVIGKSIALEFWLREQPHLGYIRCIILSLGLYTAGSKKARRLNLAVNF